MKSKLVGVVALGMLVGPAIAWGSTSLSVNGTASIYQVFGYAGSIDDSATDAVRFDFLAGSNNVFRFTAQGGLNCCGDPAFPGTADGGDFFGLNTDITGLNGLSGAVGNLGLGLLAVFTSEADPFGGPAPAVLPWDINSPSSLSPMLNQVFYVGDGRAGRDNPAGTMLMFTAPASATRLYFGFADGFSFAGPPSFYADNVGSIDVMIHSSVPEPGTLALLGLGLAGLSLSRRRKAD